VTLLQWVGRDAVVRETKNGYIIANFSMGVDESYKDRRGDWQKKVTWHRVQVWRRRLAKTCNRGTRVYVEGFWVDEENQKHTSTEIVVSEIRFLDAAPRRRPDLQVHGPRATIHHDYVEVQSLSVTGE
jgi:single stranded DNA-binding protein